MRGDVNYIYRVEEFLYRVDYEGYQPDENEIKSIGELLGQPTKKLDVVKQRIRDVFTKYIVKRCVDIDRKSICLYTLNPRTPFRPYRINMHATGTIILFEEDKPVKLLAFPMNKALSYNKSPGLDPSEYGDVIPIEVTKRVDGWQLTAYFNPLMNRWVFATRYVLHNMYFERGKLVIEDFDSIANPYVYIATKIAEEMNLFDKLRGFEEWTFTFVLEGPEPAITKPPYPLGSDYRNYRLYLLFARNPQGTLYTWTKSRDILRNLDIPPIVEKKKLSELYEEIRRDLTTRSYIAYIDTEDPVNPLLAELESELYPDAMNVKYLYDAKSAALLVFENAEKKLIEIVDKQAREQIEKLSQIIKEMLNTLNTYLDRDIDRIAKELSKNLREYGINITWGEIKKSLQQKNITRIAKKITSLYLENKSLLTPIDQELKQLLEKIKIPTNNSKQ